VAVEVGWQVKIREDARLGVDTGRGFIGMAGSGISGLKRLLSGEAEDDLDWNGRGRGRLGRVVDGFMVDAVRKSRVTILGLTVRSHYGILPTDRLINLHCDLTLAVLISRKQLSYRPHRTPSYSHSSSPS
jgi:hypothetical protein